MVVWNFYPNTAYTNYTKASVRGFRKSGAECDVLSIKPLIEKDEMALNKFFLEKKSFWNTAIAMIYNLIRLTRVHFFVFRLMIKCFYKTNSIGHFVIVTYMFHEIIRAITDYTFVGVYELILIVVLVVISSKPHKA